MDTLQSITGDEENAVLNRVRQFCEELQRGQSSDQLVNAVEETFEVTLPDDPLRRVDMNQVLMILAQNTFPKSAYPLIRIQPSSTPDPQIVRTVASQVDGAAQPFTG
ncbi:hypothetical protein VTL71DRAFT_10180, partial [Oculimacula yallundae]